jgi:hypothetical protein
VNVAAEIAQKMKPVGQFHLCRGSGMSGNSKLTMSGDRWPDEMRL